MSEEKKREYEEPYRSADEMDIVEPEPVDMPVPEAPNLQENYQPPEDPGLDQARKYAEAEQRAMADRYAQEEYARYERERQEQLRKEQERRAAKRRAEHKARMEAEMRARELAAMQEPVEVDPQASADPEKHYYKLMVQAEDGKEREPLYFDNYSDYKEALEAARETGYLADGYEVTKEEYEKAVWGREPEGPNSDDRSYEERMALVERGRKSDMKELMHDEDWRIRAAVADQGYGLEQLKQDQDPRVRAAVVRQGYDLDNFLDNDHNVLVQRELVAKGYRLHTLQENANPSIRAAVAEQGYGHDTLVHDEDWRVRSSVARYGGEEHLDILKRDQDPRVRAAVAERGYGLEDLYRDEDPRVRLAVSNNLYRAKYLDSADHRRLAEDPDWRVRQAVALNGVETDRLKNDKSPAVAKAAERGAAKTTGRKMNTADPAAAFKEAVRAASQKSSHKMQKTKTRTKTLSRHL